MPLVLLSLTPFAAFSLIGDLISPRLGLQAAALLALALVLSDWLRPGGSIKMLEGASAVLFGALALVTLFAEPLAHAPPVRMIVNGGLLAIALASLAIGRPFSLEYARETASRRALEAPTFLKENYLITVVWALVFALMFGANLFAAVVTATPAWAERGVIYAALLAGGGFTAWYIARLRRRFPPVLGGGADGRTGSGGETGSQSAMRSD